jgi:chromosomal replication initiator protein
MVPPSGAWSATTVMPLFNGHSASNGSPFSALVSFESRRFLRRRAISKKEVSATGMPTLHQEPDDTVVVGKIKEVLEQRIGSDRFGLWFSGRVRFSFDGGELHLVIDGEFALERLRGTYLRAVEAAAAEVLGRGVHVRLVLRSDDSVMLAPTADGQPGGGGDAVVSRRAEVLSRGDSVQNRAEKAETGQSRPAIRGPVAGAGRSATTHNGPAQVGQWLLAATADSQPGNRRNPNLRHPNSNPQNADSSARPQSVVRNPMSPRPTTATESRGADPSAVVAGPDQVAKVPRRSIRVVAERVEVRSNEGVVDGQSDIVPSAGGRSDVAPSVAVRRGGSTESVVGAGHANQGEPMTFANFSTSTSNTLATTAARMLAADPGGSTPLCFWGATGTGKTHLLSAIRHELRSRHRMSRVLLLSAEDFTNDFLSCVRGTGLPAFRKRYRDVDALLVDNVQFLGGKNATLREMLYTVDTILSRRRPLVLAADRQPLEIEGLSSDLAGRMSSGLVCGINPMEFELRRELFRRHAERSFMPWDEGTIEMLAERTVGDGRVIQGISQLVSMLQRMYRRMPSHQEIISQAGDLLQRGPKVVALADVEKAICSAFGLSTNELRSESKSRNVSQPRILAMYLSRQHTTAAFSEIGRYYGDRNHSTVIAAHRRVEDWLKNGQSVGGRGPKNMKVQEAIAAVENLLRIG